MNLIEDRKKITRVLILLLCIISLAAIIGMANRGAVTQTAGKLILEAGTKLQLRAEDYFSGEEQQLSECTFDESKVDTSTPGTYEATASIGNKEYKIVIEVVDTKKPKVEFGERVFFTNNIGTLTFDNYLEQVRDATACTIQLTRFEYYDYLDVLDERGMRNLMEDLSVHSTEELRKLGTTDIPTEAGIYRAVMEVADTSGNTTYKEVFVVLDKTGARIEDVSDHTINVALDKVNEPPSIDKSIYKIKDNVDGRIAAENIRCELELRDSDKHEWIVHVSYTDRAGNTSSAEFLIIVKGFEGE